ncbi:RNA-guided endonuclease InsQ/TnpB family protein [Caldicellulosiruptor morganii]|uniref:Transposase n=1 Tax=Caldicellulosiruptor morganii TaxID=1387555 RepID=A0ABY7BJJ8_9FIRM|nr:RNA-guided endonuclease TnpB family protein [Caldicellulosiruptor morganii]WAM33018.1 transposase [Caldicellulosiruptor morganii]
MDKTYILPVPNEYQVLARELSMQSGKIYSKAVSFFKKINRKGLRIKQKTFYRYMEWWIHQKGFILHSQSKQAAYQQAWTNYTATLRKIKKAKKKNKNTSKIRLPYRNKKYYKVCFKDSAIGLEGNSLILSNMKGAERIVIGSVRLGIKPKYAELLYHADKGRYYVHVVVEIAGRQKDRGQKGNVLAIDPGVIHPMVCFDGKKVAVYNGGVLNSILRYRNKKLSELQSKISGCQKGSKRWVKLQRAKIKLLRRLSNQIRDVLGKYTSHLIGYCVENGITTIVCGDVKGIRNSKEKKGKVVNQKVHQWLFRKISRMIEQKAEFADIKVVYVKENMTSQTCPVCGSKNKPQDRNYECKSCGFRYHRDGIGAINIYSKYTGSSLVVGRLACPVGVRYKAHLRCPVEWNIHPWNKSHSTGKVA